MSELSSSLYSRLVITSGGQAGKVYTLLPRSILIGRGVSSFIWGIKLPDSTVSRRHARLEWANEAWVLYDLGSANGTRVNRFPVPVTGCPLQDGDSIEFGKVQATFQHGG